MISTLLNKLEQLQIESHKHGYLDGVFASQRIHPLFPYKREDENIFFSSAIAYFLQENIPKFSEDDQLIAKKIVSKIKKCYPFFKNFQGRETYNFFKTTPMEYFPNGNIMQYFSFFKLADDADDTAYIYLTLENQKKKDLKKILVQHANGTLKWKSFGLPAYQNLRTYSVYFGKNMHIETDACVLSNILLWSFKHNLSENQQDKDSLSYLSKIISSRDYINFPYLVSPCYPTTAQIAYHVCRLIASYPNCKALCVVKPLLIKDITFFLKNERCLINSLFYNIALIYLNKKPRQRLHYSLNDVLKNTSYFYTSIPLMIPNLRVRKLQKYTIFNFWGLRTTCNAYTTMLLLEYEVLLKKVKF